MMRSIILSSAILRTTTVKPEETCSEVTLTILIPAVASSISLSSSSSDAGRNSHLATGTNRTSSNQTTTLRRMKDNRDDSGGLELSPINKRTVMSTTKKEAICKKIIPKITPTDNQHSSMTTSRSSITAAEGTVQTTETSSRNTGSLRRGPSVKRNPTVMSLAQSS